MSSCLCKMKALSVWKDQSGATHVTLQAVYSPDDSHENKAFSDATPAATLTLMIAKDKPAAEQFVNNGNYDILITKTD